MIDFDADLLSSTDSSLTVIVLDVAQDHFTEADYDNMGAFTLEDIINSTTSGNDLYTALNNISGIASLAAATTSQIRRLTRRITAASGDSAVGSGAAAVRFVIVASAGTFTEGTSATLGADLDAGKIKYPQSDNFDAAVAIGAAVGATEWGLEGNAEIPEIDIKVDSIAVTAQTKKLKAKWTP